MSKNCCRSEITIRGGGSRRPISLETKTMKFLHVSDLHMVGGNALLYGLNPQERLRACVAHINRHHSDAECVVITGDLTQTGSPEAYALVKSVLADLAMPFHLMVGNHDDRDNFKSAFPDTPIDSEGFIQFTLDTSVGRFICIDTLERGQPHGTFCDRRRAWLKAQLGAAKGLPVYLFMHHPPFKVGLRRMDEIRLFDSEAFSDLVVGRPNIKHLFFGHLHRPLSGSWQGIPFSNVPGTNHQVELNFVKEGLVPGSHEPPAYGVVFAEPDFTLVHLHNFIDQTATFDL
jgi:3',5'-cyclic-AMP phosphodiesterase